MPIESHEGSRSDFGHIYYIEEEVPVNHKIIARYTSYDPVLNRVYGFCLHGWPSKMDFDEKFHNFFDKSSQLHIQHGCLMWGFRVVVPDKLRQNILEFLHESHLGINKIKSLARSYVWWPTIEKDIEALCKNCNICNTFRQSPVKSIKPWPIEMTPWTRIHIDFLGPIFGNKYIVIVDSFSKWLEVFKMNITTAQTTLTCLRQLFARFGLPKIIVTDNGPPFFSFEFSKFMKENGINHIFSPPYHPESNGQAENSVKTIKLALKKAYEEKRNLDVALSTFLLHYRNSDHATTGTSPALLMFKRKLRTKLDLILPDTNTILQTKAEKQRKDAKQVFDVRQKVLVKDYSTSNLGKWKNGTIISRRGGTVYDVVVDDQIHKRHSDQIIKSETMEPSHESNNEKDTETAELALSSSSTVEPRYNLRPRI